MGAFSSQLEIVARFNERFYSINGHFSDPIWAPSYMNAVVADFESSIADPR